MGSVTEPGESPELDGERRIGRALSSRLEFEMALEIAERTGDWTAMVREAAEIAGGEVVMVLPAAQTDGSVVDSAVIRLFEDEREHLISVVGAPGGFDVVEEEEMAPEIVDFARASIAVFERLRGDETVLAPLSGESRREAA